MARVMVVDDSPVDIEHVRQILVRAGYQVLQVASGKDAIELVKLDRPDCIVMDVVMPEVNGFQATRTLSRNPSTASIPIIVVSAKNQESDRMWALRQGARDYLVKPVKEAELLSKIKDVLGARTT
jgi:twitching motility two-component system response regulator PilH